MEESETKFIKLFSPLKRVQPPEFLLRKVLVTDKVLHRSSYWSYVRILFPVAVFSLIFFLRSASPFDSGTEVLAMEIESEQVAQAIYDLDLERMDVDNALTINSAN